MQSLQQLKSRLKAVKNINQITKAMEVVAATKMRKAEETAIRSRAYGFVALDMLQTVLKHNPTPSPYLTERPVKNTLLVIVAADKGLAGAFNSQVVRAVDNFLATDEFKNIPDHQYQVIALGKKAAQYATKNNLAITASFAGLGDFINLDQIAPVVKTITDQFDQNLTDRVIIISTHFRTALKQDALIRNLLPLSIANLNQTLTEIVPEHGRFSHLLTRQKTDKHNRADYLFEPTTEIITEKLIPKLLIMQLYQLILEANASEHAARRVAMKNASDNALELRDDLTLEYNKSRQASITKEIIEITSTQSALN